MNEKAEDILCYIPQRGMVVVVDKLLELASDGKISSSYIVKQDSVFVQDGQFTEAGLIELMAQTAAMGSGYQQLQNNQPIKKGFIAGIKKLSVHFLPQVGSNLTATMAELHYVLGFSVVQLQIFCGSSLVSSCEMKIALESDSTKLT